MVLRTINLPWPSTPVRESSARAARVNVPSCLQGKVALAASLLDIDPFSGKAAPPIYRENSRTNSEHISR